MRKISIISTAYNVKNMLRRTLESVLRQDYSNIEHVVADAGSTDGTLEILSEYEKKFAEAGKVLIWRSEQDRGISDGINKATALSSGDFIIVLMDVLVNNHVITEIVELFKNGDIDYVFGGLIYQQDGKVVRQWSGKAGNWRLGFMAATPTLCYTREVWEKHGPYNEKYKVAGDYDFQVKIFKDKSLRFKAIPKPLVIYYAGGASNGSFRSRWFCIKECQRILRDNKVVFSMFTNICKTAIALFAYIFASRKTVDFEEWMK